MIKIMLYVTTSLICGFLGGLLAGKIFTPEQFKNSVISFFQGVRDRFDRAMTGNDRNYSSTRLLEFTWSICSLILISVCVIKSINIQEGILYLIGAAIGISGVKGAVNKMTEVKDNITKEDNPNVW